MKTKKLIFKDEDFEIYQTKKSLISGTLGIHLILVGTEIAEKNEDIKKLIETRGKKDADSLILMVLRQIFRIEQKALEKRRKEKNKKYGIK